MLLRGIPLRGGALRRCTLKTSADLDAALATDKAGFLKQGCANSASAVEGHALGVSATHPLNIRI